MLNSNAAVIRLFQCHYLLFILIIIITSSACRSQIQFTVVSDYELLKKTVSNTKVICGGRVDKCTSTSRPKQTNGRPRIHTHAHLEHIKQYLAADQP